MDSARGEEEGECRTAGTYVRGICGATTKQHGLFRRVCARNRSGSSVLLLIFIISEISSFRGTFYTTSVCTRAYCTSYKLHSERSVFQKRRSSTAVDTRARDKVFKNKIPVRNYITTTTTTVTLLLSCSLLCTRLCTRYPVPSR